MGAVMRHIVTRNIFGPTDPLPGNSWFDRRVDIFGSVADASVRPATAADAGAMGEAQLRSWRATFEDKISAETFTQLDANALSVSWRNAVTRAPSPAHRVFVACAGPAVVGFAAAAPAHFKQDSAQTDSVEIVALIVDPPHQRAGHGSRLLAACIDMSADESPTYVTTWILDGDEAREKFFREAGLEPDGTSRRLTIGVTEVPERRWSAALSEDGALPVSG